MSKRKLSRREFVKQIHWPVRSSSCTGCGTRYTCQPAQPETGTPALLGGQPVRTKAWPGWPIWNQATDEEQLLKVIRSGVWSRAAVVSEFEKKMGRINRNQTLSGSCKRNKCHKCSLIQLNVGGGDEVIVPPYTFIATIAAVLQSGAMPVFVDTNPETFQIDAEKIEAKSHPAQKALYRFISLGCLPIWNG